MNTIEYVKKTVEELGRFVNSTFVTDKVTEAFAKALDEEHRTIQQGIGKLIVGVILHNATKTSAEYDARNMAFINLCRQIIERVDEQRLKLPVL